MTIPLPRYKDLIGAVVLQPFCNIFGDEISGAKVVLGGLEDPSRVDRQWYCPTHAIGRWRMECEHGHRGQVMKLCGKHFREFRDAVTFCPACNTNPEKGHKCNLKLLPVS